MMDAVITIGSIRRDDGEWNARLTATVALEYLVKSAVLRRALLIALEYLVKSAVLRRALLIAILLVGDDALAPRSIEHSTAEV